MNLWLIKTASAQILPSRLVPECSPTGSSTTTPACDMCFLAQVGHNIIMTLIYAAFVIVIIMAITGGFRLLFQGGSPEGRQKAKKHITSAVVGLLIVLLSWVGLNLFFGIFTKRGDVWYIATPIDCQDVRDMCLTQCAERYTGINATECRSQCPGE
jgi:hypothetical protein